MIGRRTFLKYCIASAAALGIDASVIGKLEKALAADGVLPTVLWLNGANCTGCTVSLANRISETGPIDVADLLINYISLAFHPNLMGASGDLAVQTLREAVNGDFILAVDGGIPTAFDGLTCTLWTENNGHEVTAMEAVLDLAPRALAVLNIGTCASFGGMSAGDPNPTNIKSVAELTGLAAINIAGCPPHPDWIIGTVAQLLAGNMPSLDKYNRPTEFFDSHSCNVHWNCPRRGNKKAHSYGMDGLCLRQLGCKGQQTQGDCTKRFWNNGTNWCMGANSVCLGCTEEGFPDTFSPFYSHTGKKN